MPLNQNQLKQIENLKEKINDMRDYIASDTCTSCKRAVENIKRYEQEIKDIEAQK